MLPLIKSLAYRIIHNKAFLFLPIIVTPLVLILSLYFTHNMTTYANIAVVGDYPTIQADGVKITPLEEVPPFSDLMQGRFDAVVIFDGENYTIETVKGDTFQEALTTVLNGGTPNWTSGQARGEVANLTGFIMMFVLLIGIMLYRFYYEEKDGIDRRILSSPVNYIQYMLSHCIVVLLMVYVPVMLIITGFSIFHGFQSNASILQIAFIFFMLSLLGTTLGFCLSSLIPSDESAILLGSMTVIVTTLLSGGFREITSAGIAQTISKFLPQKYILDYAMAVENCTQVNYLSIVGVFLLCGLFLIIGLLANRKRLST